MREPRLMPARGLRVGDVVELASAGTWIQVGELRLYLSRLELVTIAGQRLVLELEEPVIVHHRTVEIEA